MKRAFLPLMLVALAFLTACAAGEVEAPPVVATQQALPDVLARVNGSEITRAEYDAAVGRLSGFSVTSQAVNQEVLNMLIEQHIIEQAAAELNVTVSDAHIEEEITALKALTADWDAWLAENDYTEADFRAAIASNLLTQRVRDSVLSQTGDFSTTRTVHARHILVPSMAEADSVMARLNNGELFEALAAEVSRDVTTRETGGNLGFFVRSDLTTPQLADLAFRLEPGEIAGPVETALGWHIVQTLEFGEQPVAEGGEAMAMEQYFIEWLAERRAASTIEFTF